MGVALGWIALALAGVVGAPRAQGVNAEIEYTVRLVASGRVRLQPMITHVLDGLDAVPHAFEITANKGKYQAINPAQVVL